MTNVEKKASLVSYHYFGSKSKAGFHFIAEELIKQGFQVTFVTGFFSLLSLIKMDKRCKETGFIKNLLKALKINGVRSLINFSAFHPVAGVPAYVNFLFGKSLKPNISVRKTLEESDLVIFESTPALLYFEKIKFKPECKKIYRVSDSLRQLGAPEIVIDTEKRIKPFFDLISYPTISLYNECNSPKKRLLFHGLDKEQFDKNKEISPYLHGTVNHIFVGNSHLDLNFIEIASNVFKDQYFHIIGPFSPMLKDRNNVIYHGHKAFSNIIKYIKHASTGLQIRSNTDGIASSLSDSLKVQQYTYSNLPIIAPLEMKCERANFFYYKYDDVESIRNCILNALCWSGDVKETVNDWSTVTNRMLTECQA